ncbi:hypothetical protein CYMTET_11865 [Cymbomonas tetramitiformis]|uniref:Uncharacterized protein n=1 Tax=Cymbomonas tetramitiformis TaxID=36881 RepID=A0AAE0GLM9_9CHLO|nr:hypothetical protein CYMTET_11865 [Cymbomonas tetramitiformis]
MATPQHSVSTEKVFDRMRSLRHDADNKWLLEFVREANLAYTHQDGWTINAVTRLVREDSVETVQMTEVASGDELEVNSGELSGAAAGPHGAVVEVPDGATGSDTSDEELLSTRRRRVGKQSAKERRSGIADTDWSPELKRSRVGDDRKGKAPAHDPLRRGDGQYGATASESSRSLWGGRYSNCKAAFRKVTEASEHYSGVFCRYCRSKKDSNVTVNGKKICENVWDQHVREYGAQAYPAVWSDDPKFVWDRKAFYKQLGEFPGSSHEASAQLA